MLTAWAIDWQALLASKEGQFSEASFRAFAVLDSVQNHFEMSYVVYLAASGLHDAVALTASQCEPHAL